MINNAILICLCGLVLYFYRKGNMANAVVTALVMIICGPVFVIFGTRVNSLYFINMFLLAFIVAGNLQNRVKIDLSAAAKYLRFILVVLGLYTLGWIINGRSQPFPIVPYLGELNVAIGVSLCCILLGNVGDVDRVVKKSCIWVVSIVMVLGVLQLFFFDIAYAITYQLFASSGRTVPLEVIYGYGYFARMQGPFDSYNYAASTMLLICYFLLVNYIKDANRKNLILVLWSFIIGIWGLTKLFTIGICCSIILCVMFYISKKQRRKVWQKSIKLACIIFISFSFVYTVSHHLSSYYYGTARHYIVSTLLNPVQSFSARYGNIVATPVPVSGSYNATSLGSNSTASPVSNNAENIGTTAGMFSVFLQHPIIGVGPVALEGEAIADTQYIKVLHHGGVLAALVYVCFYGRIFVSAFKQKNAAKLSIVAALALGCFSIPVLTAPSSVPFIAYLLHSKPPQYIMLSNALEGTPLRGALEA